MSTNAMWDDPYSNSKAVAVFDRADTFVGLRGKRGEVIDLADAQEIAATGGSALVGYDGGTAQDVLDEAKPMADYTALRAYTGRATGVRITQTGLAGFLQRDDADTASADNGGTIIVDASGRRWKRLFSGHVELAWFGETGNSATGDDAVFQAALDYVHKLSDDSGVFGELKFTGTVYLATPKNFGKNMTLTGGGRGFNSTFKPIESFSGGYLFGIDGDNCIGGFAFRIRHVGFTIDNSLISTKGQLPVTYLIDKAYDVALQDVWVYNARGTAVQVSLSNLIVLQDCSLYGVSAAAAESEYGVRVLSAGAGGGGGGVKLINPDIEVWFRGMQQETNGRVDVLNPYCERNITGWRAVGSTDGSFSVFGGQVESPGASGSAAVIEGHNVTVVGGMYKANGGGGLVVDTATRRSNIKLLGVGGDISDAKNYAYKEISDASRWVPSIVKNQKDVTDAVAADFYNIVCPSNAVYFGVCDITVNARDLSGYSLWTAKYRFAFSNPDGTLRVTAITEYAKASVNISANYSLAITTALSAAGTTITFRITGDSGGSLGNGQSPRISTKAELVQWDSAGAVYIVAV